MSTINKGSDKLVWGIVFLILGVLILLNKIGVTSHLPFSTFIQSPGTYFLIAGLIFIFKKEKTPGIMLAAIGFLIYADIFLGWMKTYHSFLIPLALIVVGLILLLTTKK